MLQLSAFIIAAIMIFTLLYDTYYYDSVIDAATTFFALRLYHYYYVDTAYDDAMLMLTTTIDALVYAPLLRHAPYADIALPSARRAADSAVYAIAAAIDYGCHILRHDTPLCR